MGLALVIKKLQFWWPHLGRTPILEPLNYAKFYFSFMFTYILKIFWGLL